MGNRVLDARDTHGLTQRTHCFPTVMYLVHRPSEHPFPISSFPLAKTGNIGRSNFLDAPPRAPIRSRWRFSVVLPGHLRAASRHESVLVIFLPSAEPLIKDQKPVTLIIVNECEVVYPTSCLESGVEWGTNIIVAESTRQR
jgi:hypothetical protein